MRSSRFVFYSILVAVLGMLSCNRAEKTMGEIQLLLDSLKSEYAPDTRVAYWDLTLSQSEGVVALTGEVDRKSAYGAIVRTIDQHHPEVEIQLVLLPGDGDGRLVNGLVNNSVANIRADRSSRTELVTQALLGTPVRILKEVDGWALVQTPNGYLGWVNDSEIHPMDKVETEAFRNAHKLIFTEQYGFSYTNPDETSMPVSDLVIGCLMPVEGDESGFYRIRYPDGRLAWVKKGEVKEATDVFNKTLAAEGLKEVILKFNGIPYLWGGASSKAIDCSGLTAIAFFMNGFILPRDADQQSHCGMEITTDYETKDLVPGDLLFYGRKATETGTESVSHVALYLGEGEFIHAAGYRDRVSINSMNPEHEDFIPTYEEIFVRAVRLIGEKGKGFEPIPENLFYKEIIMHTE